MADVTLWSNVTVEMQSALSNSQTVSGITKASPGVVTYVGTDPADGDYLLISALGMSQVNGRVFRADNTNTGSNTTELEGEATTSYGTFSSGGLQVVTFGVTLATLTALSASGGDFGFVDTTTIHQEQRTQIPGASNPVTYSFTSYWDPADAGLAALRVASRTKTQRCMKFTFSNGKIMVFNGYIGHSGAPTGNAQDKVETNVTVTMFGAPTFYAS